MPYGVVRHRAAERITAVEEKPVHKFLHQRRHLRPVAGGTGARAARNAAFDMPALFERLNACGAPTLAFPLREFWLDIGRVEDYVEANMRLEYLEGPRD